MAAWGLVEALVAVIALSRLAPRDLSAATRLDRFLWLSVGLDIGYVLVGATLIATGWQIGRRLGVDLPICDTVNALIDGRLDARAALEGLLNRPFREET